MNPEESGDQPPDNAPKTVEAKTVHSEVSKDIATASVTPTTMSNQGHNNEKKVCEVNNRLPEISQGDDHSFIRHTDEGSMGKPNLTNIKGSSTPVESSSCNDDDDDGKNNEDKVTAKTTDNKSENCSKRSKENENEKEHKCADSTSAPSPPDPLNANNKSSPTKINKSNFKGKYSYGLS